MDLFDYMRTENQKGDSPLANRMRPEKLEDVVGQEHILGKGKLLTRMILADKLRSIIFYGPPGSGKTTLAKVIANTSRADFLELNASTSGKKDMEDAVSHARDNLGMYGKKTILFIDEIHRFNKSQQDYLLPYVEDGTVILIGATTENPYFEVNSALLSRSTVFELKPLEPSQIKIILKRAVTDTEKGMGSYRADLTEEAAEFLAEMSEGDARKALNALELAILTTERDPSTGRIRITLQEAEECIQKRAILYDKDGDQHYDVISAFIKSMRGSDPDAAVYYLAKMLEGGEDVRFIARRMMILAAEDIGLADPEALNVAVAVSLAVERVGMPEAQIILSEGVLYLARAPKSNSAVNAVYAATDAVKKVSNATVPPYLKDAHYEGAAMLGHTGYLYPHDFPGHYVKQQYLPDAVKDMKFYHPSGEGQEKPQEKTDGDKHNEGN